MALQYYHDLLAPFPFPRCTSSRPTYVLPAKRIITARVVAIAHHVAFFYHLACARLKKAESSGLRMWLCQRCLFPEHATLSSPQPSTAPSMNQHLLDERELPMDSPNCVDNADNVLRRISQLRLVYRIPIRIPKSCRSD